MHPPWSMVLFTTLIGMVQGLLLALVGIDAGRALGLVQASPRLFVVGASVVLLLGVAALVAATFHLGRPLRAWRAAAQWRTSWLSREVIALPAFLASTLAWGAAHAAAQPSIALGIAAALLALVLYLCTGMIYAAVRAIREWAHALTPLNFALLGIASGLTLAACVSAFEAPALTAGLAACAAVATGMALLTRAAAFRRFLHLAPRSTLQSAIGVRHPQIVGKPQATLAPSFNAREFMHGYASGTVDAVRWAALGLAFVLPIVALGSIGAGLGAAGLVVVVIGQYLGMVAERWCFFTEARHPQNLYERAPPKRA